MHRDPTRLPLIAVAAVMAAAGPSLLAYNVSPSPTFWNQALAFGLWGGFVLMQATGATPGGGAPALRAAWPVQAVLAALAAAALLSGTVGTLPSSLMWSAVAQLGAAALLLHAGAVARAGDDAVDLFALFAWGWLVAGALNLAIGIVQVFAPALADGNWIAASGIVGRAVGNLRQPNHLSSLLIWSAIAVVALVELRQVPRALGSALFAGLVFGVVLTASRTGTVSVALLALWGLADRRLSRPTRLLLLAAPLLYAASWAGLSAWAEASRHTFGGAARLAETDISGSRFGIWSNTLALIAAQPWTGVGYGEFNLAWTLTPFPQRPIAFFDHTHNLPLQLAVELGVPAAVVLTGLLVGALGRVAWLAWGRADEPRDGDAALTRRAGWIFVLMIGLHSLVEYPLWYSYFLLPTAWAFGHALGRTAPAATRRARPSRGLLAPAAVLLVAGAAYSVWDYGRVTAIFSAVEGMSLADRIARGQHSTFFAHHADYAAATNDTDAALQARAFDGAAHFLLDTRFMMSWADAWADRGDLDRARHLAARLREFRNAASADWLAECQAARPAGQPLPYQCAPPARALGWRDFVPAR